MEQVFFMIYTLCNPVIKCLSGLKSWLARGTKSGMAWHCWMRVVTRGVCSSVVVDVVADVSPSLLMLCLCS